MSLPDNPNELSVNELSRRLKMLLREVTDLEASAENAANYAESAQKLAEPFYMDHGSREIKILTASCIADILRIFHPDTPYGDHRTAKNVLIFLARQLRGLENVKDTLYPRYYYLLENLTTVKTLMLALDLENSQDVTMMLIRNLLASVKGQVNEESISGFVVDIVTPLLREAEVIPFKLLDSLMLPLTEPHRTQNPFAAKLAARIIEVSESYLESTIQAFFAQTLSSTEPLKDSQLSLKTCDIFFELYKICPDILLPSMSQLANRLLVPDENLRIETMKLVLKLLKEDKTGLGDDHSLLFEAYLGRFTDIKPDIRISCLKSVIELIHTHPSMKNRLIGELISRCHDIEDGVRKEAVTACSNVAKKLFDDAPDALFDAIVGRIRDKKFLVRKEAMVNLAAFYRKVNKKEGASEALRAKVISFRTAILYQFFSGSAEDKILCEKLFHTCLVPYLLDCEERMKTLFQLFLSLDDSGHRSPFKAVQGIITEQNNVRKNLKIIIELHKQEESESRRNRIQYFIKTLSSQLPEPMKSHEDLKQFYLWLSEDAEAFERLEYIMGTSYSTKHVEDNVREMMRKASSDKGASGIRGTVTSLLERVAPLMLDTEAMEKIFEMTSEVLQEDPNVSEDEQDRNEDRALTMIKVIAKAFPHTCLSVKVLDHLIEFLNGIHSYAAEIALCVLNECGKDLERVEDGRFAESYKKLIPHLLELAKGGTPRQVKLAIKCINNMVTDQKTKESLFDSVWMFMKRQTVLDNVNCVSAITGIGWLGHFAPLQFKDRIIKLAAAIIPDIILKPDEARRHDDEEEQKWVPREKLSRLCRAKIAGIKMLIHWLLGIKSSSEKSAAQTAKIMLAMLDTQGGITPAERSNPVNSPEKAHLRLVAGSMFLKLAQLREYRSLIQFEHFNAISKLLCDPMLDVRGLFLLKLKKALNGSLPVEFLALFTTVQLTRPKDLSTTKIYVRDAESICADVIKHRRNMALQYPERRQVQYFHPELAVPHAVYLLSRQPRLKHCGEVRVLEELRECLWTLLGPLINQRKPDGSTSFEHVYKLLQAIKDHRDARCPKDDPQNQKLWVMCDVGILLIQYRGIDTKLKSNTAVNVPLDSNLFVKEFESGRNTAVYIPQELIDHEKRTSVRHRNQGTKQPGRTAATKEKAQPARKGTKRPKKIEDTVQKEEERVETPKKKQKLPAAPEPVSAKKSPVKSSNRKSWTSGTQKLIHSFIKTRPNLAKPSPRPPVVAKKASGTPKKPTLSPTKRTSTPISQSKNVSLARMSVLKATPIGKRKLSVQTPTPAKSQKTVKGGKATQQTVQQQKSPVKPQTTKKTGKSQVVPKSPAKPQTVTTAKTGKKLSVTAPKSPAQPMPKAAKGSVKTQKSPGKTPNEPPQTTVARKKGPASKIPEKGSVKSQKTAPKTPEKPTPQPKGGSKTRGKSLNASHSKLSISSNSSKSPQGKTRSLPQKKAAHKPSTRVTRSQPKRKAK